MDYFGIWRSIVFVYGVDYILDSVEVFWELVMIFW